jgi:hypothetical protein
VFLKHVSSVSTTFRHMLQPLYLDVSKVDRMSHLSFPPSSASSLPPPARHPLRRCGWILLNQRRHAPFLFCRLGGAGPTWSAKWSVARGRLFERPDASTTEIKIDNRIEQQQSRHRNSLTTDKWHALVLWWEIYKGIKEFMMLIIWRTSSMSERQFIISSSRTIHPFCYWGLV